MVGLRLGGRLQKFHAYRRRWEVVIAVEFDRLIAFRYDLTMPRSFHKLSSFVVASALGPARAGRRSIRSRPSLIDPLLTHVSGSKRESELAGVFHQRITAPVSGSDEDCFQRVPVLARTRDCDRPCPLLPPIRLKLSEDWKLRIVLGIDLRERSSKLTSIAVYRRYIPRVFARDEWRGYKALLVVLLLCPVSFQRPPCKQGCAKQIPTIRASSCAIVFPYETLCVETRATVFSLRSILIPRRELLGPVRPSNGSS